MFQKGPREKTSSSRLIWISKKGVEDILRSAFSAELQAGNATYPKVSMP